jgi:hypothetical protein
MKGKWIRSDFEDKGEIVYFFHGKNSSEGHIVLHDDGTVEFSGTKSIEIRNVGSCKEEIVVKNAADLVL